MSAHPLSGRLDVSQRVAWLRRLFGDWAMVGHGTDGRMLVSPRAGVARPPT